MARVKQPRRTGNLLRPHQGENADVRRPDPDGKKPAPSARIWSGQGRIRAPLARVWSPADNVRILEGLAAHVAKHGKPPGRSELHDALEDCVLDKAQFTVTEIYEKVRSLKGRYFTLRAAGGPDPDDATEARKYELSAKIWGNQEAPQPAPPKPKLPKKQDSERRAFEEMRCLYPNLSATVDGIASESSCGMLWKRAFELMDDEEAVKLEAKVKKQWVQAVKMTIRRTTLRNQVLGAFIKYVD